MLAFERARRGPSRWPRGVRIAVTFLIVCLSWVFFRAKTLGQAMTYLASLAGLAPAGVSAHAIAGPLYTTYHATMLALAGAIVWGLPNTWTFTSRLTVPRAVGSVALLAASILLMWTQTTNPFLYFQF
jgi:alginate O-acetyltransferase complex protein AlgI